jgi:hypothetical protein
MPHWLAPDLQEWLGRAGLQGGLKAKVNVPCDYLKKILNAALLKVPKYRSSFWRQILLDQYLIMVQDAPLRKVVPLMRL